MVHQYNWTYIDPANGKDVVKDCSRGNMYHNRRFKAEAEKRGLIIDRDAVYGWTITTAGPRLLDWLQTVNLADIQLHRTVPTLIAVAGNGGKADSGNKSSGKSGKAKQSRYTKYQCPCCKLVVRCSLNTEVKLRCEECDELLEMMP